MKKSILFAVFVLILLASIIYSVSVLASDEQNATFNETKNISRENKTNNGIGQELSTLIRERKAEIRAGNYTGPQGQLLQVREMTSYLKQLRAGNYSANTTLNITRETNQNITRLRARLSNGSEIEIKIMPNTAAERALERLRLKVCNETNNCTIFLKEVGKDKNKTKIVVYEVGADQNVRVFGIFKRKVQVKTEVNAETGEVVRVKKVWWYFLTTKKK